MQCTRKCNRITGTQCWLLRLKQAHYSPHSFHDPHDSKTPVLLNWMADFLDEALKIHLPITGVTHHEYIEVEGMSDAETLDKTGGIAGQVRDT